MYLVMETKVSLSLHSFLLLLPILSTAGRSTFYSSSLELSPFRFFNDVQGSQKGDKVEGVNKVKKYLERFGYLISSTHVDHDDHFDDALESAVKSFQRYYRLSPTGILDTPTVKEMSKSRCGVPDNPTLNNTSTSGSSHYAFFPDKQVWSQGHRHLKYTLETDSHPEVVDPVSKAFAVWADVSPFTFERTSDPAAANLKIGFKVGLHGDGHPFDGPGGTVAHAFAPENGKFHFDGDEKWVVGAVANSFDLQTIATHEIGHLLGLGHSSVPEAIMFAQLFPGVTKGLNKDDIDGIKALYPTG